MSAPDCVYAERRELYLMGDIDEDATASFVRGLRWLGYQSSASVQVVLSSAGGDEDAMFAIHDAIRMSRAEVHCLLVGEALSAAALVLACCHHRRVTPNAAVMNHQTVWQAGLPCSEARARAAYHDWRHSRWCELMGLYTHHNATWWDGMVATGEKWLLGGGAIVQAGLADEVVC